MLHCDWLDYNESRSYHVSSSLGEGREGSNKPWDRRLVATTEAVPSASFPSRKHPSRKVATGNKLSCCVLRISRRPRTPPHPCWSTPPPLLSPPTQLFVIPPAEQSEGRSPHRRSSVCDVSPHQSRDNHSRTSWCHAAASQPPIFYHQTNEKATRHLWANRGYFITLNTYGTLSATLGNVWLEKRTATGRRRRGVMAGGRFANIKRNIPEKNISEYGDDIGLVKCERKHVQRCFHESVVTEILEGRLV